MSPLVLQVLRRMAVWAVVIATALLVVPPILTEFGLLGPGVQEELDLAGTALDAARAYGATEELAEYRAARGALEEARAFARQGHARKARHSAARARTLAIEAQRAALTLRAGDRREAEKIVAEMDKRLNGLEDLYSQTAPGRDKATVAKLLSRMKVARQAGAGLSLAYEQQNFRKVIRDEPAAREVVLGVRQELESARLARPAPRPPT